MDPAIAGSCARKGMHIFIGACLAGEIHYFGPQGNCVPGTCCREFSAYHINFIIERLEFFFHLMRYFGFCHRTVGKEVDKQYLQHAEETLAEPFVGTVDGDQLVAHVPHGKPSELCLAIAHRKLVATGLFLVSRTVSFAVLHFLVLCTGEIFFHIAFRHKRTHRDKIEHFGIVRFYCPLYRG